MNKDTYYRYQMTHPYESTVVYRSKDFDKVVRKCFNNYKTFDGMEYGMFCVTNLDKNIEYKFKVNNDKILRLNDNNKQGGAIYKEDINLQKTSKEPDQNIFSEITLEDLEINKENNNCNII